MASNLINTLIKTLDVRSNPKSIYSKLDYVPKERLVSEAVNKGFTDENDVIRYVAEKIKNSPKPKSYDHFKTKPKNPDNDLSIDSTRQKVREQADQMLLDDANEYMVELENELRSGRNSKFVSLDRLENYLDLKSSSLADDDDNMNYARTLLRQIEDSDRFAKEDFEAMMKEFGERETKSLMNDPHAVAEAQQNLDIFEKELEYFNRNNTNTPLKRSDIFKKNLKNETQNIIDTYRINNNGHYPSKEEATNIRKKVFDRLSKSAINPKDMPDVDLDNFTWETRHKHHKYNKIKEHVADLTNYTYEDDDLLDALTKQYLKKDYNVPVYEMNVLPRKSKAEMNKQYKKYEKDVWSEPVDKTVKYKSNLVTDKPKIANKKEEISQQELIAQLLENNGNIDFEDMDSFDRRLLREAKNKSKERGLTNYKEVETNKKQLSFPVVSNAGNIKKRIRNREKLARLRQALDERYKELDEWLNL